MASELNGKKIAFLVANEGIEQVELTEPWKAVQDAGGTPELIAPEPGTVQAFNHLDKADTFPVDRTTSELSLDEYEGVVLPGGVANPDQLRLDEASVSFLRDWVQSGRPVAAICHGPWTLIEAGVVRGRTLTSWPSLRTDIGNAGGTWVDEQVHVDGAIVTSRKPDDLPAFCKAMVDVFATRSAPPHQDRVDRDCDVAPRPGRHSYR
jgi:protease I